jgi:hypothetical protein
MPRPVNSRRVLRADRLRADRLRAARGRAVPPRFCAEGIQSARSAAAVIDAPGTVV